ncbi:ABC-type transport auxiliary lipoprotein family protein [Rhodoferax sp. AJA081-3]|uniref:ABC-type transport auxiliary lipoprotein family protein n=1 Tax=Rhodoferax sp. AJA081-3 TaxID=2752316 RepID=UPI003530491D
MGGCTALQPKPRATVYDFGPGPVATVASTRMAPLPTLVLADTEASAALDSTAVLYRLAYSDAQQLRPYALARWSMTPAQLLRQRLREQLGQRRAVLNAAQGVVADKPAMVLHLELDEFSQLFETAQQSSGLVRLRATLGQGGQGSQRLVAQRSFIVQRPAASADAEGGVRALAAATDAVIAEIAQWLQQVEGAGGMP